MPFFAFYDFNVREGECELPFISVQLKYHQKFINP